MTEYTPRPGRCRSCGASVYWVTTDGPGRGGSTMPVNVDPVPGGNIRFVDHHRVEVLGPLEVELEGRPLWVSHFVTCPNAATHRRR